MKTLLLSISLFVLNISSDAGDVYICVSKTASKYHLSENCRGLARCTHTVEKVSVSDAKNRGYSLCGYED